MKVVNCEINTDNGFAHVELEDGLTVQCCLALRKDAKGYKKAVIKNDCGHNDGICGDVNVKAFAKIGEGACMKVLFSALRKAGVRVIN